MQLDDAASVPVQVPPPVTAKSPELAPPMPVPVKVIGPLVAWLVTVMLSVLEAVSWTLPKTSFVADRDSGMVANAVNETVYPDGLSGSGLSVTVMVADSAPIAVGANVTISVQTEVFASVEVQVPPVTLKSPGLGPLKPSLSETELV